jgi:hypothetical protein
VPGHWAGDNYKAFLAVWQEYIDAEAAQVNHIHARPPRIEGPELDKWRAEFIRLSLDCAQKASAYRDAHAVFLAHLEVRK